MRHRRSLLAQLLVPNPPSDVPATLELRQWLRTLPINEEFVYAEPEAVRLGLVHKTVLGKHVITAEGVRVAYPWSVDLVFRSGGYWEGQCPHDIGHPIQVGYPHCCDGCCVRSDPV
jgi:hypothetical protein